MIFGQPAITPPVGLPLRLTDFASETSKSLLFRTGQGWYRTLGSAELRPEISSVDSS
jgi:hypothetical protein